jgi:hypothetical protein
MPLPIAQRSPLSLSPLLSLTFPSSPLPSPLPIPDAQPPAVLHAAIVDQLHYTRQGSSDICSELALFRLKNLQLAI